MAVTTKAIIPAKQAENSQTTQYTCPSSTRCVIDKFSVCNTTTGHVVFSINLVNSGGSASAANRFLSLKAIAPDEDYSCPEIIGHVLEPGDFISTLASAATSLTIRSSGREIS